MTENRDNTNDAGNANGQAARCASHDYAIKLLYVALDAIERHRQIADRQKRPQPEDYPPLPVSIGDTVYHYEIDETRVMECPVVTKYKDHHYAVFQWEDCLPQLRAVSKGWFYQSREEAVAPHREDIEYDLRYHSEKYKKARAVHALLREA